MEPRISLITLGVDDLSRALAFYRDGLGFPTTWTPDRGVIFFQLQGTALALYPRDKLAEDVSPDLPHGRVRFGGLTLAHNVRDRADVDRILQVAEQAGGTIEKPGQSTFWGGYSGYFSDPDGHLWEVAHGAFEFRDDGSLIIP